MFFSKNSTTRLIFAALKMLLGILWVFSGDIIINLLGGADASHTFYWFLNGLVLGVVLHGIYSFIRELLYIFDVIAIDSKNPLHIYNNLVTSLGIGIAVKELSGEYRQANEVYGELVGMNHRQLIGKTDAEVMEQYQAIKNAQTEEKLRMERIESVTEYIDINIENHTRNYEITRSLIFNQKKLPVAINVVYQDITENAQLKQQLHVIEERYQRLFDELPYPVMLLDVTTTLPVEFNDALLKILGYKRGEFFRVRLGMYLHDNEKDSISMVRDMVRQREGQCEISLETKNKSIVEVEIYYRLIKLDDDEALHMIFRDITDNKKATEALVDSQQNYHALFNHANDAIFIVDPETLSIVDANELAYIWLGYDEQELKSLSIFDIDKAGLEEVTREKLNQLARHQDVLFEHEMCSYQGDSVPVEVSAHAVIYNKKLAYQYVVRDISERKVAEHALKESEERYWHMFEYNSAIMLVVDPLHRTIEDANEAACDFYQYPKEKFIGNSYDLISIGADKDKELKGARIVYEATHKLADNDIRFVEINEAPVTIHKRNLSFIIVRDVSEFKQTADQLDLTSRVLNSSTEAVVILDKDKKIISINQAFVMLSGYSEAVLIGEKADMMLADMRHEFIDDDIDAALENEGVWSGNVWNRNALGESYAVRLKIETVRNKENEIEKYVLLMLPLSQPADEASSEIDKLQHISITELPDKKHMVDRLVYALEKANRSSKFMALMLVDVGSFMDFNHLYGFEMGDKLLKVIAGRLKYVTRDSDYIAHFGADLFCILLEDIVQVEKINVVAQKVLSTLIEPYFIDNEELSPIFSIGISSWPEDGNDARSLLQKADRALSRAKQHEENSYHISASESENEVQVWWDVDSSLHEALKNNEFELYYLPQIEIQTGNIQALELLVRWNHKTRGLLEPAQFIDSAEATGFIVAIGDWVIQETCQKIKELSEKGYNIPEYVINISTQQLDEEFIDHIKTCSDKNKFALNKLAIDLDESSLMQLTEHQKEVISDLRKAGVKIQIDDYGKKASIMSSLIELSCDTVKVDSGLLEEIDNKEKIERHCRLIHALSESLGFEIVAEGVETQEQVDLLKQMQCNYAQGHYYSEAMNFDSLITYLDKVKTK